MCGVKDAGPAGARTANEFVFFQRAVSVTDGPVLMDTRGVMFNTPGRRKSLTYAMRRRGPNCRGFPRVGYGIGEVLNITAPCVCESEASFMITLEQSKADIERGRGLVACGVFPNPCCAGPAIRAGPFTPVRWTGALILQPRRQSPTFRYGSPPGLAQLESEAVSKGRSLTPDR